MGARPIMDPPSVMDSIDISNSPKSLEEAQSRLENILYLFDHPKCLQDRSTNGFKNDAFSLDVASMNLQMIMQIIKHLLKGTAGISLEQLYSRVEGTYGAACLFFEAKMPYLKDGIDIDLSVFREPYQKAINIVSALRTINLSNKEETEPLLEQLRAFYEEYPHHHILKKRIAQIDKRAEQVESQIDELLKEINKAKKKRRKIAKANQKKLEVGS